MNRTAYVSVFVRPDGSWTRAGIYSEFPCEQMETGAWAMLASFKSSDFHEARKAAMKHVKQSFPWLRIKPTRMPRVLFGAQAR